MNWRYKLFFSMPSVRSPRKRQWSRIAAGEVILPANRASIVSAEAAAVEQGLATREEFKRPLNSLYPELTGGRGRAAKMVSVGPVEK